MPSAAAAAVKKDTTVKHSQPGEPATLDAAVVKQRIIQICLVKAWI